ncbi:MAG: TolC family outer membrane protein [Alphaproteobacteria bacterium]|nr:TolC family outer membrane protein [Rhodospirillales bacterium]MCW9045568.1 TolC family outer membrane protein [Alphaproteobacteria bacterium]
MKRRPIQSATLRGWLLKNFCCAALALSAWASLPNTVSAASLKETIQLVIDTHPTILENVAIVRSTAQELDQATRRWLPQLDFEAKGGYEYTNSPTTRSRTNRGRRGPGLWLTRKETSLIFQQKIFDGYATQSEIGRQASRTDAASLRLRDQTEGLILATVRSYLDVMRNVAHGELAKENIETHNRYLEEVKARVSGGQSGVGDLQQSQSRLASAKAAASEIFKNLDDAKITFRRLTEEEPSDLTLPEFPEKWLPVDLESAISIGIQNNSRLRIASAEIDTANQEIEAAKAQMYPTLDLEVNTTKNHHIDAVRGVTSDITALLVMNYNIYRGGVDKSKTEETKERLSQYMERGLLSQRLIEEEVRRSWSTMARTKQRIDALEQQALSEAQVASTYAQEFQIGQRQLIDLLDAENQLFNAEVRLLTAQYAAKFAEYRLLSAMGVLARQMKIQMPVETFGSYRKEHEVKRVWKPAVEIAPKFEEPSQEQQPKEEE